MARILPLFISLVFIAQNITLKAQSTYAQVYQILHTNCANTGCHDGSPGSQTSLNVFLSPDSLYNQIINELPVNPAAKNNNNMIVAPGDVQHSYLLRKIAHGISDGLKLNQPSEGVDMPNGLPSLANYQIELVRQWILFGAPDTGTVIDTSVINSYYRNGGIDDTYSPHDAPASGTGFQIYMGRMFLSANTRDTEVYYKVNPFITTSIESNEVSLMEPASLHHFQLLLFTDNASSQNYPWGVRNINESSMDDDLYGIGAGPGLTTLNLPPTTAFYFQQGQMFDIDLHIQNPSIDSIYSTDIYVNVYTEPSNTTSNYMYNTNFPNFNIMIPPDGQAHNFIQLGQDSTQTHYWNIWRLYSHTHKYGTAFNIWLQNPDGSKGAEVYDGNYSYELGYDVGYYRNGTHSTVRTFPNDSLLQVNPLTGLIGEATWVNTGPDTMWWGLTTAEEMMVFGFFYDEGPPLTPTAVEPVQANNISTKVFPNPVADEFVLQYDLSKPAAIQVDLTDMMGNKVANLLSEDLQDVGRYTHGFKADDYKLTPGMYLVSFNIGGKIETQKLIITE